VGSLYIIKLSETKMNIIRKLGYHANTDTLLKRIVAISGDVVHVTNDGILINSHLLKHSKAYQFIRGVALNPLPIGYNHKLATNEYFVMGESDNSYDSRYFGVIGIDNIVSRADFIGCY
jgi:signal peptidase I